MPSLFPQGTFEFSGGIPSTAVLSARVVQSHGIVPDTFFVRMNMLPVVPQKNGDVTLSYGSTSLTFPGCTIDYFDREADKLVWNVHILDRRWRWRFAVTSGVYNARWKNGTELRTATKTNVSDLCSLLLKSMGESDFDLSAIKAIDGQDFPFMEWDCTPAADALRSLCERYGFEPAYTWNGDKVKIVRLGEGESVDAFPDNWVLQDTKTHNPAELPGRIICRGGPTSVQGDLPLFPVGADTDGQIKPIALVSYAQGSPTFLKGQPVDFKSGTYADNQAGFWNVNGTVGFFYGLPAPYLRELAAENILRLYRIQPPNVWKGLNAAKGDQQLSTVKADLENFPVIDQANQANVDSWIWRLDLQSEQNDRLDKWASPLTTTFNEYNKEVQSAPYPAWVYGQYCNTEVTGLNVLPDDLDAAQNIVKAGILKLDPATVFSPQKQNASTLPGQDSPTTVSWKSVESGFYTGGFEIIPEWGLVKFAEPVFQILSPINSGVSAKYADGSPMPAGRSNFPPALWLRTRMFLRDPDTRGVIRAERVKVLDKNNPSTDVIVHDDLILKLTFRYKGPPNILRYPPEFGDPIKTDSNWDVVSKAMDAYIDQRLADYQTLQPQALTYAGFVPAELDGITRGITWTVDESGYAKTFISRDTEYLVWHQRADEKRMIERLKGTQAQPLKNVRENVARRGVF